MINSPTQYPRTLSHTWVASAPRLGPSRTSRASTVCLYKTFVKQEYWPTVFGIIVNLYKLEKYDFKIFILWLNTITPLFSLPHSNSIWYANNCFTFRKNLLYFLYYHSPSRYNISHS